MNQISYSQIKSIDGFTVEWTNGTEFILSKRNLLFHTNSLENSSHFRYLGKFPFSFALETISSFRLARRLLRAYFYNVLVLEGENRIFTTFKDSIGIFDFDGNFQPIKGLKRKTKVLRGACALDQKGGIYFGEYLSNDDKSSVHIYFLPKGSSELEIVHTFSPKEVRHIHGIYYDPYTNNLWCTTGDLKHECKIIFTSDGFNSIKVLGEGDESWRAVSLLFDHNYIYYGTDSEYITNRLFKVEKSTGIRKELSTLPGPVYYSSSLGNYKIFAVTAEGCPSQNKNSASLWTLKDDKLEKIYEVNKDIWDLKYFMFGTIHFNYSYKEKSSELFCYFNSLEKVDNTSIKLSI